MTCCNRCGGRGPDLLRTAEGGGGEGRQTDLVGMGLLVGMADGEEHSVRVRPLRVSVLASREDNAGKPITTPARQPHNARGHVNVL